MLRETNYIRFFLSRTLAESQSFEDSILDRDINQLPCDFSLVGQRDVYNLLGPIHYKELVRVCLKAYAMPVHIIRRNKISILLADRSECLVDQFLVSDTVFRLESDQKGLRTCPSRLCND